MLTTIFMQDTYQKKEKIKRERGLPVTKMILSRTKFQSVCKTFYIFKLYCFMNHDFSFFSLFWNFVED